LKFTGATRELEQVLKMEFMLLYQETKKAKAVWCMVSALAAVLGCTEAAKTNRCDLEDTVDGDRDTAQDSAFDADSDSTADIDAGSDATADSAATADADTDTNADTERLCELKTMTFQNGVNGYADMTDIEIRQAYPETSYSFQENISVDRQMDLASSSETQGLLRFKNIFGDKDGQIPRDAAVESAFLTVFPTDYSVNSIAIHRMLKNWSTSSNWNSFSTGVFADDVDAVRGADDVITVPSMDFTSFDVTESLLVWQNQTAPNYGWVFLDDGNDGWTFAASGNGDLSILPALTVTVDPCALRVVLDSPEGRSTKVDTAAVGALPMAVTVFGAADGIDVSFFSRKKSKDTPWTLIVIPDTQIYSASHPEIFQSMTKSIVDYREALNIQMVMHMGDITNSESQTAEWDNANAALSVLFDNNIPLTLCLGNHDHSGFSTVGATTNFSATFPASRFEDFPWWEDGSEFNDNNDQYVTLTIGSDDYLFMALDFCPDADEIAWANDVLSRHPNHKAVLSTHSFIDDTRGEYRGTSCSDTSYIFNDLVKKHANLRLVLCGHQHSVDGEFYRVDENEAGLEVFQLVTDYQTRTDGGDGRLRMMTFDPSNDEIRVHTYSPYTRTFDTDADSQFALPIEMVPFAEVGRVFNLKDGQKAALTVSDLDRNTEYEWYATATSEGRTVIGPRQTFTSGSAP
jgi:hypothetical protein